MLGSRPRVLVLADIPNWAWCRKARAYEKHLSTDWAITVAYQTEGLPDLAPFDLIHTFEFPQTGHIPPAFRAQGRRVATGLTAHVWRTWGRDKVREWAQRADGIHTNSLLLHTDLAENVLDDPFDPPLYYTPNGVDEIYWHRYAPAPDKLIVGHVGKPNPRKGAELIINACRRLNIECRVIQRTARLALSADAMRDWYQGVSLQVTASEMDGTPNPMLESAACSNALLSTRIGNMPEFIRHGQNGWLVSRTEEAYIETLADLKSRYSEVLAAGKLARDAVLDGWTWARQVRWVDRLWRGVLNGR